MNKRTLHWSYLNFRDIPMDLYLYEDLEEIYLKENHIVAIPSWFLNLTTLKFIHLSGNNIITLPEEIYLLENLEFLDVSHNQLEELPETLCLLLNLEQLNVSSNLLTELPNEIDSLKRLETLNVSSNQLHRLPIQLCECSRLHTLNVSNNVNIWHIPERIAYMPSLQMFSAERCSLAYLPVALAKFIDFLRIFNNSGVNHIPMIYEKFYQNYYENRNSTSTKVITHEKLFWVVEKEANTKLLLPIGTRQIFKVPSKENQVPLYDDCLKALESLNRLSPIYRQPVLNLILPETYMVDNIKNGPLGRCTVFQCSNPLFTSYYFMVVKRRASSSRQLFTCYFCTQFCANRWLSENFKKYYNIDWEIWNGDDELKDS